MYTSEGYVPTTVTADTPARTLLTLSTLLHVSGPDSERFLQGQLTCDVKAMTEDQWSAGACCTAKGRMVANFIIARTDDGFLMRLPASQADTLIAHLKKYIVFFKSKIDHASGMVVIGECHSSATAATTPTVERDSGIILTHSDGRREFWISQEQKDNVLGETQCAERQWIEQEITAGWAWVVPDSTEAWVPQYIGWQAVGGISFSKGCYTGQEVVARLQYLGKSKRNLYLIESDTPLPNIMTDVVIGDKASGEVAATAGQLGLAVISSVEKTINATVAEKPVVLNRLFYTEENS